MKTMFLILSVLVLTMSGSAEAQVDRARLVSAMTTLERAYIAALVTTNEGKPEPSRKAMARLDSTWQEFRGQVGASLETQNRWASSLAEIEKHLKRADAAIAQGGALAEAHQALEPVRMVFMDLRRHDGIDFFPDHLTAFHEPSEALEKLERALASNDAAQIIPRRGSSSRSPVSTSSSEIPLGWSSRSRLDSKKRQARARTARRETRTSIWRLQRTQGTRDSSSSEA